MRESERECEADSERVRVSEREKSNSCHHHFVVLNRIETNENKTF